VRHGQAARGAATRSVSHLAARDGLGLREVDGATARDELDILLGRLTEVDLTESAVVVDDGHDAGRARTGLRLLRRRVLLGLVREEATEGAVLNAERTARDPGAVHYWPPTSS